MSVKAQQSPQYQRLKVFLRQMREDAGLTQQQLAKRLRVPQSFVYKSETAIRRIDITEFAAWSEACGKKPVTAYRKFLSEK
ncbi:MAG: helix-turn-helix transcriptional regulator [Phycisphaerae bacterium]